MIESGSEMQSAPWGQSRTESGTWSGWETKTKTKHEEIPFITPDSS